MTLDALFTAYLYLLAAAITDDRRLAEQVGWPRATAWVWLAVLLRWALARIPDNPDDDRSPR